MKIRAILAGVAMLLIFPALIRAQTDVSLFFKNGDKEQLEFVESESGDLYSKLGHHGPAIENPWYGLRLYFDKKAAIDVYSKARTRLELREKQWYPSKDEQLEGWGADYYKVGKTVGLGGVKLWDDGEIIDLHPVTKRIARVMHFGDSASMEMISEGVPYQEKSVNIRVLVTVYGSARKAKVEASTVNGENVQFVTGINYFDNLEVVKTDGYIATWGLHPEDVAAEQIEVGAAFFLPAVFNYELEELKDQIILISEPCKDISFEITTASKREAEIRSMEDFISLLETLIEE